MDRLKKGPVDEDAATRLHDSPYLCGDKERVFDMLKHGQAAESIERLVLEWQSCVGGDNKIGFSDG